MFCPFHQHNADEKKLAWTVDITSRWSSWAVMRVYGSNGNLLTGDKPVNRFWTYDYFKEKYFGGAEEIHGKELVFGPLAPLDSAGLKKWSLNGKDLLWEKGMRDEKVTVYLRGGFLFYSILDIVSRNVHIPF